MKMKRITAVLVVDAIEPCLAFWVDRLRFEVTVEVPDGDALGFVALSRDGTEVMLQTAMSVAGDMPALAEAGDGRQAALFIEVDELDAVVAALEGADIVSPLRETFYGSTELTVREPGGHIVTFARFGSPDANGHHD